MMRNALLDLIDQSEDSMESTFLAMIALVDQAESIANDGVKSEFVTPKVALSIGELKQLLIEAFGHTNELTTLAVMRRRFLDEEKKDNSSGPHLYLDEAKETTSPSDLPVADRSYSNLADELERLNLDQPPEESEGWPGP